MLTETEYKAAFKEHRLKTSYLNRVGAIDGKEFLTVAYSTTIGHRLEKVRQSRALRVREQQSIRLRSAGK